MAHVFISYSRKDTEFVEKLERDLLIRGFSVWRDAHNIPGGEEWYQSIVKGLDESYAMLCVVSTNADLSRWVLREQLYGDQKSIPRIAILPQAHPMPFHLIESQPIACHESHYSDGLARLQTALGLLRDKATLETINPASHTKERDIISYLDFLLAEAKADLRDSLYVSLIATPEGHSTAPKTVSSLSFGLEDDFSFGRLGIEQIHSDNFDQQGQDIPDARQLLREKQRIVLLGEPGAGKTTTLLQLAVDLAREARNGGEKLPVFVPLRQFDGSLSFEAFVKAQMSTLQSEYLALLYEKRLILLLDALNEMPRKSHNGRDLLSEVCDYLRDKNGWIVSCRIRDYQEDLAELGNIGKIRLKPLDPPRIYELMQKQFARLAQDYPDKVKAEEGEALWRDCYGTNDLLTAWQLFVEKQEAQAFWNSNYWPNTVMQTGAKYGWNNTGYNDWNKMQRDKSRILYLCRNPYMVNMVCRLYALSKKLPDHRGALFAQFVDKLLEREKLAAAQVGVTWIDDSLIRKAMAQIAYQMGAETEMLRTTAEKILQVQMPELDSALILRLGVSANLIEVGESLRFSHQLLQEYFAGEVIWQEIENNIDPTNYWKTENWWESNTGRDEALIILAGGRSAPEKIASWVAPAQPDLAIRVLKESGIPVDLQALESSTKETFLAVAERKKANPLPYERATAYRILGYINEDKRQGIGLDSHGLPEIVWSEIPEGKFFIAREKYKRILPAFQISKYPITNAQYQIFINMGGYNERQWWTEAGWEWKNVRDMPDKDYQEVFGLPNYPRVNISWYEALAFCNWLTYQYSKLDKNLKGNIGIISLPSAEQWEKASRGADGRIYTWGNTWNEDKCNNNVGNNSIGSTSAVGIFPESDSVFGVSDMVGNIWEWCATAYHTGSNILEGKDARVMKGGSWLNTEETNFCLYYQDRVFPSGRYNYLGFRLVRTFPTDT